MKNIKIIVLSMTVLITLSLGLIFILKKSNQERLSKIEKLYLQFTQYMKDVIDNHLKYLKCDKTKYYFGNKEICFHCKEGHACFGYALISAGMEKKMNPQGAFYIKSNKFNTSIANFYTNGLASLFHCKGEKTKILKCDFDLEFQLKENFVDIILTKKDNLIDVSKKICNYLLNTSVIECKENLCICQGVEIRLLDGSIKIIEIINP